MSQGEVVLRLDCRCGHWADLRDDDLGEPVAGFDGYHRLRCTACGRRGRPATVTNSWRLTGDIQPYRGIYDR